MTKGGEKKSSERARARAELANLFSKELRAAAEEKRLIARNGNPGGWIKRGGVRVWERRLITLEALAV